MADKILCFSLSGYSLGVEADQVEKILINKQPMKDSFTLETGVEVKSLKSYIPLPARERGPARNILFLKDQKDFYGFTVDRLLGYLKLRGSERLKAKKGGVPIKYIVRNDSQLIPVLDLQFITNNDNSVSGTDIDEIAELAGGAAGAPEPETKEARESFDEVNRDEVYRTIDEQINKRKRTIEYGESLKSEKKGIVLPLVVNVVIIAVVSLGMLYYFLVGRKRSGEFAVGEKVSGIEEEVIKEIRRRSEAEVEEQRKKLEDARQRLGQLQKEKDFFLQNQNQILTQREKQLNEAFQRELEEAKKRIEESGVGNITEAFEKERERLYRELLESRDKVRQEVDQVKKDFEKSLKTREESVKQELEAYTRRVSEVEEKLLEEQAKLKEAEEKARNVALQQQEYLTFRKQINGIYSQSIAYFKKNIYPQGIAELKKIPPVITKARDRGIGAQIGLKVEKDLADTFLYLAEREQSRPNLDQIAQKTFDAAQVLERDGKLQEALSRYFTAYSIGTNTVLQTRALSRAESLMDSIYRERSNRDIEDLEKKAETVFAEAVESKRRKEYEKALSTLEGIIVQYAGTSVSKKALDEIIAIRGIKDSQAQQQMLKDINRKAGELMKVALAAYDSGSYAESLARYEEVATKYKESDFTQEALSAIKRINEEMRNLKFTPSMTFKKGEVKTGVVVQVMPDGVILLSMGSEDNVQKGDIVQVFRNIEGQAVFAGSVKIYEVNPQTSKARVIYFEKDLKIGDLVSY